jgi:hypothetical protein
VRFLPRLILVLLLLGFAPSVAYSQEVQWRERTSAYFSILYGENGEVQADSYAGFADQLFEEVTGVFGHRPATPITLRLFPDLESYYQVNPRARGLQGVVAHSDFRRNEIVVIITETEQQSEDDIRNTVRHELTHMVASDLSENRLNAGFQEGIAQYIEVPTAERDRKIELLRTALNENRLLPWSSFDNRDAVYGDPNVSYPQTLSVITYLAQRTSFSRIRDFLSISASSSGYRSALERTFGAPPDDLERDWLEWLPSYVAGGFRGDQSTTSTSRYDLARAEQLLSEGLYSDAVNELAVAVAGLQASGQDRDVAAAESLLARARAGVAADVLAQRSRDALLASNYPEAADLAAQARAAYLQLGDMRQEPILAEFELRAQQGLQAAQHLNEAVALTDELRYPQARILADQAAAAYTALGDRERASQALDLRTFLDQRQSLFGGILLILGVGGVLFSLARRMMKPEREAW